ncbi:MAG TPA: MraY family glycosyltransferase [Bacteroidia bacterium]|jgi:UDP-GlcNAc:undecaprenyl-phosphate GlcNAc-1-phosphate transferase|nr:MraY family glycosyltransferase [Bacteroidia bacterium]
MDIIILTFFTAFSVVLLSTPALIKVAILKRLFDEPGDERKLHKRMVPTIGGIIIFAGTIFAFSLWFPSEKIGDLETLKASVKDFKYVIATVLILFFVGVKDDIIGTAPIKKLVAHVIVGMILVTMAQIKLTSMHGIFGITQLPDWGSVFVSLFTYIVVVNAFNLIDGVDGLAAGVGVIAATAFSAWFYTAGDLVMAALAVALAGSLVAFLIFNFNPAKIFMGDSGSLSIGLIICVLAIKMVQTDHLDILMRSPLAYVHKPIFAMCVLVYPLVDTLRIFVYRAVRGMSPFSADRNHLHHLLIDGGCSHKQTVLIIYMFNIFMISLSILLRSLDPTLCFCIIGSIAIVLAQIPQFIKKRHLASKH